MTNEPALPKDSQKAVPATSEKTEGNQLRGHRANPACAKTYSALSATHVHAQWRWRLTLEPEVMLSAMQFNIII